jgi:hypothetical protein
MPLDSLIDECIQHAKILLPYIPNLLITLGRHGIIVARRTNMDDLFPIKTSKVG